jgi:uncharacterized protein (DUF1778 family)
MRLEVSAMAAKTQRIEMRADPDSAARIAQAAQLLQESVSSFVLRAATAEADRVLARANATLMPADQFDDLIASLDEPDAAPALSQLAAKRRRFTRP